MRHLAEPRAGQAFIPRFIPPFSALLWGAVEFFALTRSRWAARLRTRG